MDSFDQSSTIMLADTTVLPGRHLGVSDIELGVPGQGVPIWRWNGRAYEFWKQAR